MFSRMKCTGDVPEVYFRGRENIQGNIRVVCSGENFVGFNYSRQNVLKCPENCSLAAVAVLQVSLFSGYDSSHRG